jgi:hypothetical protein
LPTIKVPGDSRESVNSSDEVSPELGVEARFERPDTCFCDEWSQKPSRAGFCELKSPEQFDVWIHEL